MNAKILGGLLAATMMLSGVAHAASLDEGKHGKDFVREQLQANEKACIDLSGQLQAALSGNTASARAAQARTLLEQGRHECNYNREQDGVKTLTRGLGELGLKPAA